MSSPAQGLYDELMRLANKEICHAEADYWGGLIDAAKEAGIECVIGHRTANLKKTDGLVLKTFTELGVA